MFQPYLVKKGRRSCTVWLHSKLKKSWRTLSNFSTVFKKLQMLHSFVKWYMTVGRWHQTANLLALHKGDTGWVQDPTCNKSHWTHGYW